MSITDHTMFGVFINTSLQVMLVGSIFMVLFLTVLCFLLFSGFVGFVLYVDFVFFVALGDYYGILWLSVTFLWFLVVFRVAFWALCVFAAFCVVFYFSTYGKKVESEKLKIVAR